MKSGLEKLPRDGLRGAHAIDAVRQNAVVAVGEMQGRVAHLEHADLRRGENATPRRALASCVVRPRIVMSAVSERAIHPRAL